MPRLEPDSLLSSGGVPTCNKPSVSSSLSSMDSSRLVAPCLYLQMICVQSDMGKKAKTVVWHQDLHSIGWAGLASLAWAGFCDCHGIDPSNFSGTYLPASGPGCVGVKAHLSNNLTPPWLMRCRNDWPSCW